MKRRRRNQHLKTLCQCSSWAGFNYQPITVSIHKLGTNHKAEILALALTKSDRGASFTLIFVILQKKKKWYPLEQSTMPGFESAHQRRSSLFYVCNIYQKATTHRWHCSRKAKTEIVNHWQFLETCLFSRLVLCLTRDTFYLISCYPICYLEYF